jgi:uncharacterized protein YecT (DUF1311 family)
MLTQALVGTILLAASLSVFSQRAPSGEECLSQGGNADARECLFGKTKTSESALVRAERDTVSTLEHSSEELMARQRAVATFNSASAAFRRYREEQCAFQVALAAGGSGATHRGLLCEIALNEERTSYLRSIQGLGQ